MGEPPQVSAPICVRRELGMRELTLPEVLVRRRIHANTLTRRLRGDRGNYARILKASLDRRREPA
jgi:hypothetical protein